jgi:putative FmdB family regulatory protein
VPLYEYQCKTCGHRFEKIKKFSDEPEKICPKCGGHVDQMMSAPAVQFKGAGWYVTDYAKKSGGPKTSSTESSTTEAKTETKSETKSDTKSDSKPSTPDKK